MRRSKHRYAAQTSLRRMARSGAAAAGRYPHPQPEGPGIHGAGAQPPVQDLRLHLRRDPLGHSAHGEKRRGADGLHGRGYPAGRAVGKAPAAVLLLQADVRAGHEPAHRRACARRSSPIRPSTSAPTAICWPTARKTAASCRSTTPSLPAAICMKIEALRYAGPAGRRRSRCSITRIPRSTRALDRLFRRLRPGLPRGREHPHPLRPRRG